MGNKAKIAPGEIWDEELKPVSVTRADFALASVDETPFDPPYFNRPTLPLAPMEQDKQVHVQISHRRDNDSGPAAGKGLLPPVRSSAEAPPFVPSQVQREK